MSDGDHQARRDDATGSRRSGNAHEKRYGKEPLDDGCNANADTGSDPPSEGWLPIGICHELRFIDNNCALIH
ncbi:hypothetical protein [Halohasta salina]|uniref:hypothetical protein n=1 Tax=Halohasta salina TaxID=2961621 RepID=UPI0020A5988F|nr:hypothetical protein [Halohasta salina]